MKRSRFIVRPSLSEKAQSALYRAWCDSACDARYYAREGRRVLARRYAETCRMLIGAFGKSVQVSR